MPPRTPKDLLASLLEGLGFDVEIEAITTLTGPTLNIRTADRDLLIGREGEILDDLQFLLNRLLQAQDPTSPKAHLDVEGYRQERNARLLEQIREYARLVRDTGQPFHLEPMKAYDRRLVHHAFLHDPEVTTWSPPDDARIKRITLMPREGAAGSSGT